MSEKKKEIEELKDETERRELVRREKILGEEIEKIEKSRITPDIISIQQRIIDVASSMLRASRGLTEEKLRPNLPIGQSTPQLIDTYINNYISIRKDICHTIKKRKEIFLKNLKIFSQKLKHRGKHFRNCHMIYLHILTN